MKKIASLILKISAGLILIILILLFIIPILFKQKIKEKVEESVAASLKATVKFEDYSLGFFRDFPNLSFSLTSLSVVGVDKFDHDTLAAVKSFNIVLNLSSLFKKSGYEVKSILIDNARINAIVLKDGAVNWDILRDTSGSSSTATTSESGLKIKLKKVALLNSSINYLDAQSNMQSFMNDVNLTMSGDMTMSETDMRISGKIADFTFIMDGMKYLNKVVIDSRLDLLANIDKMKFTFRENYLAINDLKLTFSGVVLMPANDIETDIQFKTMQTSFASLLSLIPAIYMKDYKEVKSNGEFELSGTARGIYSSADSTMPDVALTLSVSNGTVSYPSLPDHIKNINISSKLFIDGKVTDRSTVDVDKFHMELAGTPFDMSFSLRTPVSDPDFKGSAIGKIDMAALSKAIQSDSMKLSGIIDMAVSMAGRMSMIEKGKYDDFSASGKIGISDMVVAMKGYPSVKINRAAFEFTPAFVSMTNANLVVGRKSDFELNGRLANYIPYFFKNQTIRGNISLRSKLTDASQIMSEMVADTTVAPVAPVAAMAKDTSSLSVIKVPKNIDLDFEAMIDEFRYDNINAQKVKGHLIVRNGVLSMRETGMNIMNGSLTMNADYDTRDILKPVMKADMEMQSVGIKDAFKTFNTVKMLVPAAKGIDGKINLKLGFESLLGSNMMPVIKSISGEGKLKSDEITLVESETFNKVKQALKLGDNYSNTFKNVSASFKITDGRIYVSPFDVKTGNLKMNISGDQGLDQSINYLVKTEMPRSELGGSVNALIDNLAAQAAAFGISYKPSDIIKVNLKVTGTFSKPVISPVFGNPSAAGAPQKETVAKEAVTIGKEKAREEAEKQAAQLVKDAESAGQQLRDEAAKAAESLKKEADARAKKILDDSKDKSSLEKMAAQQGAEAIRKGADKQAAQLNNEADVQAKKLVEEAKSKGDELIKKI